MGSHPGGIRSGGGSGDPSKDLVCFPAFCDEFPQKLVYMEKSTASRAVSRAVEDIRT